MTGFKKALLVLLTSILVLILLGCSSPTVQRTVLYFSETLLQRLERKLREIEAQKEITELEKKKDDNGSGCRNSRRSDKECEGNKIIIMNNTKNDKVLTN